MATALNAIGIIEIIGGVIAAVISIKATRSLLTPIIIIAGCFVCGILFCAAGKGIELLENMVSNQNKIIAKFIPESVERPDSEENPDNNESEIEQESID